MKKVICCELTPPISYSIKIYNQNTYILHTRIKYHWQVNFTVMVRLEKGGWKINFRELEQLFFVRDSKLKKVAFQTVSASLCILALYL